LVCLLFGFSENNPKNFQLEIREGRAVFISYYY
jgi:hypothetical protein